MRINNIDYILQELLRYLDMLCHMPRVGKDIACQYSRHKEFQHWPSDNFRLIPLRLRWKK